jgi:Fe-S cluster assembly iron-binding protein IscA
VHVTDTAREALSALLARRTNSERCLRLSTVQGNYRFVLDEPIEQDITFSFEERIVLVVSETVSRDLWGITVDTADEAGKRKLVFRKARHGEPFDTTKEEADVMPAEQRALEHERLLEEIAEIGRQIATLRGGTKSHLREQLHVLEAKKQAKWDAIRTLWAGDGQFHKRMTGGAIPSRAAE